MATAMAACIFTGCGEDRNDDSSKESTVVSLVEETSLQESSVESEETSVESSTVSEISEQRSNVESSTVSEISEQNSNVESSTVSKISEQNSNVESSSVPEISEQKSNVESSTVSEISEQHSNVESDVVSKVEPSDKSSKNEKSYSLEDTIRYGELNDTVILDVPEWGPTMFAWQDRICIVDMQANTYYFYYHGKIVQVDASYVTLYPENYTPDFSEKLWAGI